MVTSESIMNISGNFDQQLQVYKKMLDLSVRQLHLLEDDTGRIGIEELNILLAERQNLMAEIDRLNTRNKELQKEISQELGIDEFVLSGLESVIDEAQCQQLKLLLAELGEMLRTISDNDEKSQILMRLGIKPAVRQKLRVDSGQVSSAYKQAMQQKPPK